VQGTRGCHDQNRAVEGPAIAGVIRHIRACFSGEQHVSGRPESDSLPRAECSAELESAAFRSSQPDWMVRQSLGRNSPHRRAFRRTGHIHAADAGGADRAVLVRDGGRTSTRTCLTNLSPHARLAENEQPEYADDDCQTHKRTPMYRKHAQRSCLSKNVHRQSSQRLAQSGARLRASPARQSHDRARLQRAS
jgi:hypothetical protein